MQWKMMVYFMDTRPILTVFCDILWTFGVISSNLVYFSRFGILYKEKSGNSDRQDNFGCLVAVTAQDHKNKIAFLELGKTEN
jgi:hypothetical protein